MKTIATAAPAEICGASLAAVSLPQEQSGQMELLNGSFD